MSVLVPARNEELTLPRTLPVFLSALDRLGVEAELLVIVPPECPYLSDSPIGDRRVRWLPTNRPGKFQALMTGARNARGDLLVLADADVWAGEEAFRKLIEPLVAGTADVSAARMRVVSMASTGQALRMELWASLSMAAWHLLRDRHVEYRWALPGALYAIRADLFPSSLAVPLVDDASIGLSALRQGARFAYVPEAEVGVSIPQSYRSWVQQKLRSRRGWRLLADYSPREVRGLERQMFQYFREVSAGVPTARMMRGQDRLIRLLSRISPSRETCRLGAWVPDRTYDARMQLMGEPEVGEPMSPECTAP